MGLEKQHDITNFFLFVPCILNHGDSFFANTFDHDQFFDIIFDDIKGFFSEFFNDTARNDRTQAFDESGTEVFLNAKNRCRNRCFVVNYLKLFTELGMVDPFSPHV